MRKLALIMSLFLCLGLEAVFAQTKNITGVVTGLDDGQPIPGVSVSVKGSSLGTITTIDGTYSINVPSDATSIVFSFVGMKTQEIAYTGQSKINVVLASESFSVDEIVVTGVGTAVNKKKIGISVEGVKSEAIQKTPERELSSALIGKIPGAQIQSISGQPGQQQSILLRGINSVGSTQPMILVDGIEINTDNLSNGSTNNSSSRLADIDLSNIERIEVVQGAAAATIYGAQGANGVIQIFTKKGQAGKTHVDAGYSYSVQDYLRGEYAGKSKYHYFDTNSDGYIVDGSGNALEPDSESGIWPEPVGAIAATTLVNKPYKEQTYDQVDQLFKDNTVSTNSYLTLSGGSDKMTYLLGLSNLNQESIINGRFNRTNMRLNLSAEIVKGLQLNSYTNMSMSSNTTGGITGQDNVYSGLGTALNSRPFVDFTYKDALGNYVANPEGDNSVNPLFTFAHRHYSADVQRVIQNFNLNYKINDIFKLDGKYGYDIYRYDYRDEIDNQTLYNSKGIPPYDGQIEARFYKGTSQNAITSLFADVDFKRDFGIELPITWLTQVAYDYRKKTYDRTTAQGTGLPTFTTDANLAQTSKADVDEYNDEFVTYGYLVNTKFDYEAKAGVSFGFRTDWSSAFGEGSTPFTFPRADAYINLSEFDFWSFKDRVSNFKIRAAYGEAGIQPGPFDRIITLKPVSIDQTSSLIGQRVSSNQNLGVQVSKEFEVGTDIGFNIGNDWVLPYISLGFTYWDRSSEDVIRAIDVTPSSGATSLLTNSLTLVSDGIQASINATAIEKRDVKWTSIINFSKSKSMVDKISNGEDIAIGNNFVIREGESVGAFLGYKALSSLTEQREDGSYYIEEADRGNYSIGPKGYVVDNASKKVMFTDEKVIIGDPNPDFSMSFINDVTLFNRLTLGFQLDWTKGGQIYNQTRQWMYRDLVHNDVSQSVTINGESGAFANYYSSLYNGNSPDNEFVEDGTFVRLRSLYVSFDFAKYVKSLSKLKLTLSGNNLITWTKYSGFDPEAASNLNEPVERGLDQYAFPNMKTYSVSLDISF